MTWILPFKNKQIKENINIFAVITKQYSDTILINDINFFSYTNYNYNEPTKVPLEPYIPNTFPASVLLLSNFEKPKNAQKYFARPVNRIRYPCLGSHTCNRLPNEAVGSRHIHIDSLKPCGT